MSDEHTASVEESPVLYERLGSVGVLTLNRPKALNSMTVSMLETIGELLDDIETERLPLGLDLRLEERLEGGRPERERGQLLRPRPGPRAGQVEVTQLPSPGLGFGRRL